MANSFFQFKQFTIHQERCAMKVTTDACLFGAWAASRMKQDTKASSIRVLDIGAGTGLLSLMIAQQINASIDAIEIDEEACKQAGENIDASPWHERLKIFYGDVRKMALNGAYDFIISNPPFYENELASGDSRKNIAHHQSGLLLNELLNTIKQNLSPDGRFYLLLPYKRKTEIDAMFENHGLAISHTTLVRQSTRHNFFRICLEGSHSVLNKTAHTSDEMSITDENKQYTQVFVELLKDYYLYL